MGCLNLILESLTRERDDILRAVVTLKPLGSSISTLKVGPKTYIRSVPRELNTDQSAVLEVAQLLGYVTVSMLMINLRWPRPRAKTSIKDLTSEGMLWVDKQCEEWEYWSPGLMTQIPEQKKISSSRAVVHED